MNSCRLLRKTFVAVLLLTLAAGTPVARAEYVNGSFMGIFTDLGGTASFTLPEGAPFPQVTVPDHVPAPGENHVVAVSNGGTMDFYLNTSELGGDTIAGQMRFTLLQLNTVDSPRVLVLGTYTLSLENDGVPYLVSGPVLGDALTLYLPGKDPQGTPDTADDVRFLIKVHAAGAGVSPARPDYLMGRAQILVGTRVLSSTTETVATATDFLGHLSNLDAPGLLVDSTFNQVAPPDGSEDFSLDADTPAVFASGILRSGTIGAGDGYSTVSNVLRLMPGGVGGIGIGVNRFTRTLAAGRTMEGFTVTDLGPTAAGAALFEGHVFAFQTGQASPALLLGTIGGSVTSAGLNGTVTADLVAVDSAPPEVYPVGDHPPLFVDRYQSFPTYVWDFNGWRDVKSVQLLVNESRASDRILARYDAAANRLSLYNRTTKQWVGRCAPGAAGTLRTPWVSLSCRDTAVEAGGEMLVVRWSLKPTARMLPPLAPGVFVKATDRAGQVAGWRQIIGWQEVYPVGP